MNTVIDIFKAQIQFEADYFKHNKQAYLGYITMNMAKLIFMATIIYFVSFGAMAQFTSIEKTQIMTMALMITGGYLFAVWLVRLNRLRKLVCARSRM